MLQMKSPVPERVSIPGEISVVTTAHFHDCALNRDGTAYCWGTNADGEIGDGTRQDAAVPQRVATNRRLSSITAGGNVFVAKPGDVSTWGFSCGLAADDGSILCWDDNRHGALGNGTTDRALRPTLIARP